jgi:hypothetical protein
MSNNIPAHGPTACIFPFALTELCEPIVPGYKGCSDFGIRSLTAIVRELPETLPTSPESLTYFQVLARIFAGNTKAPSTAKHPYTIRCLPFSGVADLTEDLDRYASPLEINQGTSQSDMEFIIWFSQILFIRWMKEQRNVAITEKTVMELNF